jgi:hypothetical protein
MSSQIPHRFGSKNYEMTATESARNFLRSKERITISKIKQSPQETLLKHAITNFRFDKIFNHDAHVLNVLTHMDHKRRS